MVTQFNSTLSWLDSSESERRAVMELVSALNEPGTLDELGIGSIRDTISDALFPGTSTIQTRTRYFLFIPWILQMVEAMPTVNSDRLARQLQLQLCDALDETHGAGAGVIGREARAALKRWPSSIYWVGLERWGIRREPGSTPSYQNSLRRPSALLQATRAPDDPMEDRRYESADGIPGRWAAIPPPPPDFPEKATFHLTPEEARFLCDCIDLKHPHTYLAHILREGDASSIWDADFPWEHVSAKVAPSALSAWLHDAKLFSLAHQGAAILYSLMLAEGLADAGGQDTFSTRFAEWFEEVQEIKVDLKGWDRAAMWRRLRSVNPRLRVRTLEFADHWYALATTQTHGELKDGNEARRVIRERERTLKGVRARLTYPEALNKGSGYPTSARLEFRWSQVQRIVADILEPLE